MTPLSNDTLRRLGPAVAVPGYDRAALRTGFVHFGVGNFHRVHLAVYVDRCLAGEATSRWGICGVEIVDTPANRAKAAAYAAQDGLYTVTESAPDGTVRTRVIGAMTAYLHAPTDPEAVLRRLASPDTHIVSLTITEGGYNLAEASGEFDLNHPDLRSDLSRAPPRTVFGFVVEGFRRRRAAGLNPFTIMSCDNLRHNGDTARKAIVGYARALDADLASWIDANAAFPNSMVDRIAPQVPDAVRLSLNAQSGVEDLVPALCEDFMQFVLEDEFSDGRPDLEAAGVEIRDDVGAFEVMKQRILNASHMMLGYPGLLMGYRVVHEAMTDPRLHGHLDAFCERDVIPHLEAPRGVSVSAYKAKVLARFANPAIGDQLQRLCMLGWAKFPVYHGRILRTLLATGGDTRREAFFLACVERYLAGIDDRGQHFVVDEPHVSAEEWEVIRGGDPVGFLRGSPFAPLGLSEHEEFRRQFVSFRHQLADVGCAITLERLLADTDAARR